MGTATRKLSEGEEKQSWLVRNEQGETFGPVDFETLKAWACDGRLAPANEVSGNGVDWQLATANRPLEMNWVAEVTPGTFYGPIHRHAMEELVRDGSIARSSAFFARHDLDGKVVAAPDETQNDRVKRLTEQCAQLQQALAAAEGQSLEAKRLAVEREEQGREARRQLSEAEAQLKATKHLVSEREEEAQAAKRVAAGLETQARLAQGQAEQTRQHAETVERQLRAQLAEHDAQAQCRVAAYEEQVRLAQQQACAYAEQVEAVRRQAAEAEAHLRATVQQMSAQAEQAHAVQQQWMAKADSLAGELEAVRKAHTDLVAKAAEQNAERASERIGRDARERALEAERNELASALAQGRSEMAAQAARLARLEAERQGAAEAGTELDEMEVRLRTVSAELAGVQQALACEKEAAQQAEARCGALEKALQAAQARDGDKAAMAADVSGELRQLRGQIEALSVLFRQTQVERVEAERKEARPSGHVYVEAEPVEVLPPEKRSKVKSAPPVEPERPTSEGPKKPSDPPKNVTGGRAGGGLSLAELEQQARRELERLGAQGANLFKRK